MQFLTPPLLTKCGPFFGNLVPLPAVSCTMKMLIPTDPNDAITFVEKGVQFNPFVGAKQNLSVESTACFRRCIDCAFNPMCEKCAFVQWCLGDGNKEE